VNLNVLRFEFRLNRFAMVVISLSLLVFEFILVGFYSAARPDQNMIGILNLIPKSLRALAGDAYIDILSVNGFLAFGFTHPLAVFLLCTGAVIFSSRSATSGADNGLNDLILSHPVPRYWVLFCRAGSGEIGGFFMVCGLWLGHYLGTLVFDLPTAPMRQPFVYVAINAYLFFLAVLGLGHLAAALSKRRASAVGFCIAVLSVMFFLKISAQFWSFFDLVSHASILNYYVPGKVVMFKVFPWEDVLMLAAFYLVFMVSAVIIFNRRDI
jgi:ABC-type transport system involved in multi-copper enzyme maturation permease subunit